MCPRGEREEGGEGALKKAVRLNHLVSEQTAGSPLSIVCCWEDAGPGRERGWLMTMVLGINPQKMFPAGGLVAVPFLLYTMNSLFWPVDLEERK